MDKLGLVGLLIPIVTMVGLFTFLSIGTWAENRRKEREAFYRNELMQKVVENPGPSADRVVHLMREEHALADVRRREGRRLSGLVTMAVGLGVAVFFWMIDEGGGTWTIGLIPFLIGLAIFLFATFGARSEAPGQRREA
jgi:hypothetical protein